MVHSEWANAPAIVASVASRRSENAARSVPTICPPWRQPSDASIVRLNRTAP